MRTFKLVLADGKCLNVHADEFFLERGYYKFIARMTREGEDETRELVCQVPTAYVFVVIDEEHIAGVDTLLPDKCEDDDA